MINTRGWLPVDRVDVYRGAVRTRNTIGTRFTPKLINASEKMWEFVKALEFSTTRFVRGLDLGLTQCSGILGVFFTGET